VGACREGTRDLHSLNAVADALTQSIAEGVPALAGDLQERGLLEFGQRSGWARDGGGVGGHGLSEAPDREQGKAIQQ
jgi:hypothetical protein